MKNDDIDRVLSNEDSIVPSSGFAASVMEAVRREAEIPPPIPFPWTRALPGLIAFAGALIALFVIGFPRPVRGAQLPDGLVRAVQAGGWIGLATAVSLVSVIVGTRGFSRVGFGKRG